MLSEELAQSININNKKIEFIKGNYMDENKIRLTHEQPAVITEHGWRYHHIGIPYIQPKPGEKYDEHLKIATLGFETSPYGIEWIRFEKDCPVPDIVRNVAHLAFEVDNLDEALKNKDILLAPGSPSRGIRVAFIIHDGAPIELMEFNNKSEKLK